MTRDRVQELRRVGVLDGSPDENAARLALLDLHDRARAIRPTVESTEAAFEAALHLTAGRDFYAIQRAMLQRHRAVAAKTLGITA